MTFHETMKIGLGALGVNRMRSTLTVLGIIVGVAAVVCMVSVGAGAEAQVTEKIRTLGANLLVITPGAPNAGGVREEAGKGHTLTEDDALAIGRRFAEVQVSTPVISGAAQVVAGNRNWATLAAGIDGDYFVAREWPLAAGRSFTVAEAQSGAKVAIVGAVIADQLFQGRSAVGETLRIANVPFTIIGVLDKKGQASTGRSQDDVVFMPISTAKSRVLGRADGRDGLDFIVVKVADSTAMPAVRKRIATLLHERHRLARDASDDFQIENPADVLTAREGAVRTFSLLLVAIASVSLVVGGISIMNIMLVSVTERTREIGLRMAVGARRRDILQQFLVESAALALFGGALGVVLGIAAAATIAWQAGWPVLVSPGAVLLAAVLAGLVGISFGLYPAYRASRLDPMIALRYE